MKPQPLGLQSVVWALFVSILWGGNLVALKLGLETVPPFWSAFWRMAGATVAVALWARLQGVSLSLGHGERGPLAVLAGMFVVQISCLNTGADWTSPGYAVVLLNSHPVFTNLFGHFTDSEDKLRPRRLVGLALALGGMTFVAFGRPEAALAPYPIVGNALMIVSASLLALRVIYTRRLVQTIQPLRLVVWQMVFSLPVFVLLAGIFEPSLHRPLSWQPVAALLYQGPVIAGFCFVSWTLLLKKHSAGTLSMFGFFVPFFGVFLSALVFDEAVSAHLLTGAALVTLGVVVVTRKARPSRPSVPETPAVEPREALR